MKFGIIAQGSNGDVEILSALALGLLNRGHHVEMFIITFNNRDYSFLNKVEGLTIFQKHIYQTYRSQMNNFEFWNNWHLEFYHTLYESFRSDIEDYTFQFAQRCDCLIGLFHICEVSYIARLFNIPFITVNFPMEHIRSSYESPLTFESMENRMDREEQWDLFEKEQGDYFKRRINGLRRRLSLKYPDIPCLDRVENGLEVVVSSVLNLIPYSTMFVIQKPDVNPIYKFCGYLKSSGKDDWNLPFDLQSFMEADLPPVFITVGSMIENENDLDNLHSILLQAAHQVNRRVIVLSNWEAPNAVEGNVYKLAGFVSYSKILSKCAFVVHHGGIGIMHHTLESGCPSVIIKYGHDQFYNAKLLFDLGLSNGSIDRKELKAEVLSKLINAGLENNTMKRRVMEFAEQIKKENGVLKAVGLIEAALINKV